MTRVLNCHACQLADSQRAQEKETESRATTTLVSQTGTVGRTWSLLVVKARSGVNAIFPPTPNESREGRDGADNSQSRKGCQQKHQESMTRN